MPLNVSKGKSLFPDNRDFDEGIYGDYLKARQTFQGDVIVAKDGSGNTTDIQEAIDLLPSSGGQVFIKAGTYEITSSIVIPFDNITIRGIGKGTEIKANNFPWGSSGMIQATEKQNLTFSDFFLNGVDQDETRGIKLIQSTTANIVCHFTNLWFNSCGIGILGDTMEDCIISGCHFDQNLVAIQLIADGFRNLIIGNTIIGQVDEGIELTATCDNNTMNSNIFASKGIKIANANCDNNMVHDNQFTGAAALVDSGTGTSSADNT